MQEASVQSLSRVWLFATPWTAVCQASQSITNSQSLLKLMSIKSVVPSNHRILCHPLLLLPSIFPSFRVFTNESVLRIRWPKYWSFSFSTSPSNEYSGLISFRIDCFDLLAVQGTLKSLLQHHSSKASILRRSAFFIVQLAHPYMTTGKTIALTKWTFDGKIMSLLFNMLSNTRLVTAFLPRGKSLLTSWPQSPSAVILEPKKTKSITVSIVSPSICHEVRSPEAMIFVFWMLSFKPAFSFSYFTFIKRLFSSSSLSAIRVVSLAYLMMYLMTYLLHIIGGIRDACSIPGSGRSLGEGKCNPLQCSCLEKPMDRGAWWAAGVAKSWTWLKRFRMHAAWFRVLFTKHRDCVIFKSPLPKPCFWLRSAKGIGQRLIKPLLL